MVSDFLKIIARFDLKNKFSFAKMEYGARFDQGCSVRGTTALLNCRRTTYRLEHKMIYWVPGSGLILTESAEQKKGAAS